MSYNIQLSSRFQREAKRLAKKYASFRNELNELKISLQQNPMLGTPIAQGCYKIRIAIESKGKGKSGGARVITYVYVEAETVYLLSIFDKSEQENISDQELAALLKGIK
jgi:mRNA-degrading endonuclease RelE of RelBE toxin-antitoxin system